MDQKTLEAVRHSLSILVSELTPRSLDHEDAGDFQRSDELWQQMHGARQALRIVDQLMESA